jgi:hypothetical protein
LGNCLKGGKLVFLFVCFFVVDLDATNTT